MVQRALCSAVVASFLIGPGVSARADMPADCTSADNVVSGKIRALMRRSDTRATWLVGNSISAIKQARAQCLAGHQETALRQYGRVLLYMETQEAALNGLAMTEETVDAAEAARAQPQYDPW
jgi:hypothetical protein